MNLKFYRSVTKGLNIKVTKFRGLVPTFLEVTGEKLVGGDLFAPSSSWIGLNLHAILKEGFLLVMLEWRFHIKF